MPKRTSKNSADVNSLAARIVGDATGDKPATPAKPKKNPHAVALGRKGGQKGGAARKAALSPERRAEIAKAAAKARWGEKGDA